MSSCRTGENQRIAAPSSPPSGASHVVARSPIDLGQDPGASVADELGDHAATWKVDETRPSARSWTSVWRTDTSVDVVDGDRRVGHELLHRRGSRSRAAAARPGRAG